MNFKKIEISADSSPEDIAPFALAIHELLGLPVTMRSLNKRASGLKKEKSLIIIIAVPCLKPY